MGFNDKRKEYIIEDMYPKRPLINYLWNESYIAVINVMKANINKYGFDKDHYIYGINDKGEVAGSYTTEEGQIFLNPQTWAVMARVTDTPDKLLDLVENELSCDFGYVQQKPCFTKPNANFGRITYFGKGFYENGACYNHGTAFKLVADCVAGRGNEAYVALKKILPNNKYNDYTKSGVEPYALCNMFFGPENEARGGEAPMAWITGTSSWTFRGIVEYIIGVRAEFVGLRVAPQLPDSWKGARVKRVYRNSMYDIEIKRGTENRMIVDGNSVDSKIIPEFCDNEMHTIIVELGKH